MGGIFIDSKNQTKSVISYFYLHRYIHYFLITEEDVLH